ncbi:hypothetical protein [Desulfosporosinus sp. Sb-LF]|uniref:hypothetical protein n=1 Tax=Desulfosporosinus sp. Sb-LF TaxID=2560027 RepID=UPI00107F2B3E|nr:hypothetical protein [Desulfosporosinus sp. Sb-LF]TGE33288.1 hypothetical protein E4K68_07260 [Desulfosporosinus sp. Sb-LF]
MNTHFEAAVVTEQGKSIAVVSVQPTVFQNSFNASTIIKGLLPIFEGIPVVLMTLDPQGAPAYFGRSDLILILETINVKEASWKEVTADIDLTNSCPMKEVEES